MDAGRTGVLPNCPNCEATRLRAVTDGEETNFLCPDCGACWHVELGWVHRVDPASRPGRPGRPVCTSALAPASSRGS